MHVKLRNPQLLGVPALRSLFSISLRFFSLSVLGACFYYGLVHAYEVSRVWFDYLYWGDIQSLNEMVLLNEAFIILVSVDFDLYWSLDQWPALWVGVEWFVGFGYIGIRLSSFMWGLYYLAFVVLCVCTNVQICWVFFLSLSLSFCSFFLKPSAGHHLWKLDWAVVRPSSLPDCLWHITKVFRLIVQLAT